MNLILSRWLWVWALSIPRTEPSPHLPRVELPLSGWTSATTTHLMVDADPGRPLWLGWRGLRWLLSVSPTGQASAWLPILPGRNLFEVSQGEGGRETVLILGRGPPLDLMVIAGWSGDRVRLDLRVTDPTGEVCDAKNRRSQMDGLRLRDDPESPGPHLFLLERAVAGEYRVSLACGRLPPGQSVRVQVWAFLHPGTPQEESFDLSGVVTRCDEPTELGSVAVGTFPVR